MICILDLLNPAALNSLQCQRWGRFLMPDGRGKIKESCNPYRVFFLPLLIVTYLWFLHFSLVWIQQWFYDGRRIRQPGEPLGSAFHKFQIHSASSSCCVTRANKCNVSVAQGPRSVGQILHRVEVSFETCVCEWMPSRSCLWSCFLNCNQDPTRDDQVHS